MLFHHIGIITKKINKSNVKSLKILNLTKETRIITDKSIGVKVQFFKDKNNLRYELIEPMDSKSPLYKIAISNRQSLHHIAYKVKNFDKKIKLVRQLGYAFLTKTFNAKAFNNKRVIFLLSPFGFIVELIEN